MPPVQGFEQAQEARDADRFSRTYCFTIAQRASFACQEPVGGCRGGRGLAAVPGGEFPPAGGVHERESAAAQTRGLRLDHVQDKLRRDRRIDRVASGLEDVVAGARGQRIRGDDHEVLGVDGRLRGVAG